MTVTKVTEGRPLDVPGPQDGAPTRFSSGMSALL
jgi:hypothetical protein